MTHQELVNTARKHIDEINAKHENRNVVNSKFDKIGTYIPSSTEKEYLERLSAAQKEVSKAVLESTIRF